MFALRGDEVVGGSIKLKTYANRETEGSHVNANVYI